jgi:hypothetical protein
MIESTVRSDKAMKLSIAANRLSVENAQNGTIANNEEISEIMNQIIANNADDRPLSGDGEHKEGGDIDNAILKLEKVDSADVELDPSEIPPVEKGDTRKRQAMLDSLGDSWSQLSPTIDKGDLKTGSEETGLGGDPSTSPKGDPFTGPKGDSFTGRGGMTDRGPSFGPGALTGTPSAGVGPLTDPGELDLSVNSSMNSPHSSLNSALNSQVGSPTTIDPIDKSSKNNGLNLMKGLGLAIPMLVIAPPKRQNPSLDSNNIHELFCNALIHYDLTVLLAVKKAHIGLGKPKGPPGISNPSSLDAFEGSARSSIKVRTHMYLYIYVHEYV